jgi:hypothetical protein
MSWDTRLRRRMKNLVTPKLPTQGSADGDEDDGASDEAAIQYRLAATSRYPQKTFIERVITCGSGAQSPSVGINPNQKLAMYLHWMFRVNFFFLFVVMCTMFFALVIFFTGLIMVAGKMDPQCVRIGGNEVRNGERLYFGSQNFVAYIFSSYYPLYSLINPTLHSPMALPSVGRHFPPLDTVVPIRRWDTKMITHPIAFLSISFAHSRHWWVSCTLAFVAPSSLGRCCESRAMPKSYSVIPLSFDTEQVCDRIPILPMTDLGTRNWVEVLVLFSNSALSIDSLEKSAVRLWMQRSMLLRM